MSPINELYDYIFDKCEEFGFDTYDHLPLKTENAQYPFVIVGEQQTTPTATKTGVGSSLYVTVHVWGSRRQRQQVDEIASKIETIAYNPAFRTEHYAFSGRPGFVDDQRMIDDSVANTILWHQILTLSFVLR